MEDYAKITIKHIISMSRETASEHDICVTEIVCSTDMY